MILILYPNRGNLFGIAFVLGTSGDLSRKLSNQTSTIAAGALRASPDAHPPLNMLKALTFMGVFAMVICFFIILLRGEQKRKMMDEAKIKESAVLELTTLPYEDNV